MAFVVVGSVHRGKQAPGWSGGDASARKRGKRGWRQVCGTRKAVVMGDGGRAAVFPDRQQKQNPRAALREMLDSGELLMMPCCFDALSARLVENAGFPLTFMSGFSTVAAARALPDAGLLSYGEVRLLST